MKNKRKSKRISLIFAIANIAICLYMAAGCTALVYNITLFSGIEDKIRSIVMIGVIVVSALLILGSILLKVKNKKIGLVILIVIMAILSSVMLYVSSIAKKASDTLDNITSNKIVYSTSIVTLKESSINDIKDVVGKKLVL